MIPGRMHDSKPKIAREEMMAFLLGELEDAETSRIEEAFMDSGSIYEQELEAAKEELFEQYNSGAMSAERSGRFEKRFLQDALKAEKADFKRMLDQNERARTEGAQRKRSQSSSPARRARAQASRTPGGTGQTSLPRLNDLSPITRSNRHTAAPPRSKLMPLALAGLLLIGGGALGFYFLQKGNSSEEAESEAEAEAPSDPRKKDSAELTLAPFSVRGQSQLFELPNAKRVVLRLPLPAGASADADMKAWLHRGEEKSELKVSVEEGVPKVAIQYADLQTGRYEIELVRLSESGDSASVAFYSVRR